MGNGHTSASAWRFLFRGVQHLLLGWRVLVASIASAFKRMAQWTCFSAESVKFRFFATCSDSYDRTSILRDSSNQHDWNSGAHYAGSFCQRDDCFAVDSINTKYRDMVRRMEAWLIQEKSFSTQIISKSSHIQRQTGSSSNIEVSNSCAEYEDECLVTVNKWPRLNNI